MKTSPLLFDSERLKALRASLERIPEVRRFDAPGESQADTLAHAISDIEEACREVTDEVLPRLVEELDSPGGVRDALGDLGEALAHILYHVHDAEYYRYVIDRGRDSP